MCKVRRLQERYSKQRGMRQPYVTAQAALTIYTASLHDKCGAVRQSAPAFRRQPISRLIVPLSGRPNARFLRPTDISSLPRQVPPHSSLHQLIADGVTDCYLRLDCTNTFRSLASRSRSRLPSGLTTSTRIIKKFVRS